MKLTNDQLDALQELINIGVGRAASTLNQMVNAHIYLQVPFITVVPLLDVKEQLKARLNENPLSSVQLSFNGLFSGVAQLVFPTDSASTLVAILTGEELGTPELDSVKIGTLTEIGNIVINGVMGSISNILRQHLDYSLPLYVEADIDHLLTTENFDPDVAILFAQARFKIEQLHIMGDIILIFKVGSLDALLSVLELGIEA
ncbi:MAG: chemotaxis protein CheC [Chroococcales cyanobacterium]